MGKMEFNGVSTEDLGLVIQTPPIYTFPERDLSSIHIPGRNGDLYIDNKCYKNIERSYSIAKGFAYDGTTYVNNSEQILSWLTSANGKYAKLKDSYDPDVYRMAVFNMSGSFTNVWDGALTIAVSFQCKPQRYLVVGDIPVENEDSNNYVTLLNHYHYPALPIIEIKNFDASVGNMLMLSTKNYDSENPQYKEEISLITITNYNKNEIIIDSEEQTVYDNTSDKNDASQYVGLNGKSFPILYDKMNEISLKKYEFDPSPFSIDDYNYIISTNQIILKSEYKDKDALEQQNQEKVYIRSYEELILSKQQRYTADAVQTLMTNNAEEYKFISYNDILSNICKVCTFTGNYNDNDFSSYSDWIDIQPKGTTGLMVASVPQNLDAGFYFVKGKDKLIKFKEAGDEILDDISPTSITTIYYYEAITDVNANIVSGEPEYSETWLNVTPELGNIYRINTPGGYYGKYYIWNNYKYIQIDAAEYLNDYGYTLKANYSDIPSWAFFEVTKWKDNSPTEISFKANANGYYWRDKTWLFGKAFWTKFSSIDEQEPDSREVLNSLSWNSSKGAFVSSTGLSTSSTATFTYRYLATLPQYQDITVERTDENGKKYTDIVAKVRFTITDLSTDASSFRVNITVDAADPNNGFYSLIKNDNPISGGEWNFKPEGAELPLSLKGTDSFEIIYVKAANVNDIPTYENEENWPEWLNPIPEVSGALLKYTSITFKVKKAGYYRYSLTEDETGTYSDWEDNHLDIDDPIVMDPVKTWTNSYYICMIETIPSALDWNRDYTLIVPGEEEEHEKPDWLEVHYFYDKEMTREIESSDDYKDLEDKSNVVIQYKVGNSTDVKPAPGSHFKWDSMDSWVYKIIGSDLLTSGHQDDTTFYFMSVLPSYPQEAQTLYDITPYADSAGNPDRVVYTIKSAGYYRVNNNTDWKNYNIGEKLLESKVSERNTIYHLIDTGEELDNVIIKVTPRWWML